MFQALIFDLDDTLYPERDFVASGYRAVAQHISDNYGASRKEVFNTMMGTFLTEGRSMVLPLVIGRFLSDSVSLTELVEVYRQHVPKVSLFPGYAVLLRRLRQYYRLGIITDGLVEVQKRKVEALELEDKVDKIVYTWEYGSEYEKPHTLTFFKMLEYLGAEPSETLFVGDNPQKDGLGAQAAGMRYAQICTETESHGTGGDKKTEFTIESLHQLVGILKL